MRIKITADSTCDLSPEQIQANNIDIFPLYVSKGEESFRDGVDIQPADIVAHVAAGGGLCSTSAVNMADYVQKFSDYAKQYDGVLHISLGSGFSSSYQNACLAAHEYPNIRVIDSKNLSTGQGHIVMEAVRLAKTCESLDAAEAELNELTGRVEASFLMDKLEYMVKGGRCSMVSMLGANLLQLKPCIDVAGNKMFMSKKYRGAFNKSIVSYVRERLEGREDILRSRVFITHTDCDRSVIDKVREVVEEYGRFEEVVETEAGCTITCHCGPGTLGVLFIRNK